MIHSFLKIFIFHLFTPVTTRLSCNFLQSPSCLSGTFCDLCQSILEKVSFPLALNVSFLISFLRYHVFATHNPFHCKTQVASSPSHNSRQYCFLHVQPYNTWCVFQNAHLSFLVQETTNQCFLNLTCMPFHHKNNFLCNWSSTLQSICI